MAMIRIKLLSVYFWLLMLALLPVVLWQSRRVRETVPRLPEAAGAHFGVISGKGDALQVLIVGESTAVGVGVNHLEQGLAGHLARGLARRGARPVRWQLVGQNGITVAELHARLRDSELLAFDVAVLVVGVNDAKSLHSPARWRRDLAALLQHLRQRAPQAQICISAMPELGRLPALPQPLAHLMGIQAARLDLVTTQLIRPLSGVCLAHTRISLDDDHICSDGIHPSEQGYAIWARDLVASVNI